MQLTEDQIRRIARREATSVYSRGGGVGFGGVSAAWVEDNYLSKEFFSALFKVYDGSAVAANEIEPNDELPTTQTNINVKSIFGLWTPKFLSALGQGSGGSASTQALYMMIDVKRDGTKVYGAATGKVLMYGSDGKWYAGDVQSGGSGTVTSVGMTVPTGMLVSAGSSQTITNNGTFAITFASGYSLLSASDKQAWDALIGYFDNDGNALHALVADALDVAAACNVWGQEYMGANGKPKSVTGKMSNVGDIVLDYDTDHLGLYRKVVFRDSSGGYLDYVGHRYNSNNGEHSIVVAVGGTEYFAFTSSKFYTTVGILSESYVTALSDIRFKEVVDRFELDIEKIAAASLIHFTWKDRENDHSVHAGGIAQEWQEILPEAVVETEEGKLAMDYGVIGVASAISLARKVKEQQREIDELKRKNAEIEARMERLEKLIMEGRR